MSLPHNAAFSKPYILIVDDDPDDRLLLRTSFLSRRSEMDVEEKTSGPEAIDFLHRHLPGHPPALMVLDYDMPEMTGCEVARLLSRIAALTEVPTVIWSHSGRYFSQCTGLHVAEFIVKPASTSEMDRVVGQLIALLQNN